MQQSGELISWDAVRTHAQSKTVESFKPAQPGSPDARASLLPTVRVPVRELRRTMDRVPRMYVAQTPVKTQLKRAGYDTSSSEEEGKGKSPSRGRRQARPEVASPASPHIALSPSSITIDRGKGKIPPKASPPPVYLNRPIVPVAGQEEGTIYERSLRSVAAQSEALQLTELEKALEKSGATAKLRAMTNEEARQDQIERSMYELAEIPPGVGGHLKRTLWALPDIDDALEFFDSKRVKREGKRFPLWGSHTGRFCFTGGMCRMAALVDPIGEGTRSEVRLSCVCVGGGMQVCVCTSAVTCSRFNACSCSYFFHSSINLAFSTGSTSNF